MSAKGKKAGKTHQITIAQEHEQKLENALADGVDMNRLVNECIEMALAGGIIFPQPKSSAGDCGRFQLN